MTLAEVLITITIVSVVGLSIMASLQAGIYFQQSIREENGATRAAADLIDEVRKELFSRLENRRVDVLIDDRGTALTGDDLRGIAELRFYAPVNGEYFDEDGQYLNEVGLTEGSLPTDLTMLIVEVTVKWNRAGRIQTGATFVSDDEEFDREVVLSSLLAP
jgi:type II secretory pathway pseudopilin PulG